MKSLRGVTERLWLRAVSLPIFSQGLVGRVVHRLSYIDVVFEVSINSRVLFVEPFPTTEALAQSNAWPVVGQWRARRDFSSCRLTAHWWSFMRVARRRPVWSILTLEHSVHGLLYTTFSRLSVDGGRSPMQVLSGEIPLACERWWGCRDVDIWLSVPILPGRKAGVATLTRRFRYRNRNPSNEKLNWWQTMMASHFCKKNDEDPGLSRNGSIANCKLQKNRDSVYSFDTPKMRIFKMIVFVDHIFRCGILPSIKLYRKEHMTPSFKRPKHYIQLNGRSSTGWKMALSVFWKVGQTGPLKNVYNNKLQRPLVLHFEWLNELIPFTRISIGMFI